MYLMSWHACYAAQLHTGRLLALTPPISAGFLAYLARLHGFDKFYSFWFAGYVALWLLGDDLAAGSGFLVFLGLGIE